MRHVPPLLAPEPTVTPPAPRRHPGRVVDQLVREGAMDAPVSGYYVVKRCLDCLLSLTLLVLSAPLVGLAMLLVKLTSRGPMTYTQSRVGYGGRVFTIYK